ncbi:sugar phosphate isomerase/epimerase family protein [Humisphaera borealis]|uniref:Sugar phosphate isomerase/epimerase n=1 Tax=Humisphaera borealis TaxID=2807512 RepID=A0A7M2WXM2_9BACT|nr:sugar phosphate isomerase/epimerase family protein [Humisphaera borealis]QOV90245.1 sugar phosphate isomerase/epimerase [Humisphaera borealis]
MQLHGHTIAVCSWSLQPKSMAELVAKVKKLGVNHMQLALNELSQMEPAKRQAELAELKASGIQLTGGMLHFAGEDYSSIARIRETGGFIPDGEWGDRKKITADVAKLAKELNAGAILAHVGFVPPHGHAGYKPAVERVREVAKMLAAQGLVLHMETGQEPAGELLSFMNDLNEPNVFINFDPANMILYGAGEPIPAIKLLGKHIKHVHAKDATASARPGVEWGAEVPFGTGQVGVKRFLSALKEVGYTGPLALEREAGDNRLGDIAAGIEAIKSNVPA